MIIIKLLYLRIYRIDVTGYGTWLPFIFGRLKETAGTLPKKLSIQLLIMMNKQIMAEILYYLRKCVVNTT